MLHRLAVGWGRFVKLFYNKPTEGQADRKAAVPVLEKTAGKTEAIAEEVIGVSNKSLWNCTPIRWEREIKKHGVSNLIPPEFINNKCD